MKSPRSSGRLRLAFAFGALVATIGLIALSVALLQARGGSDGTQTHGSAIQFAQPISYKNGALCVASGDACVTPASVAAGVALYPFDTDGLFRGQACGVKWTNLAKLGVKIPDPATGNPVTWAFRSACRGAIFDSGGHRLFGPADGDLDTFPLTQQGNALVIDTNALTCHRIDPLADCTKVGNSP